MLTYDPLGTELMRLRKQLKVTTVKLESQVIYPKQCYDEVKSRNTKLRQELKKAKALIKKLEARNAELEEQAMVNFESRQRSTALANQLVFRFQRIIYDRETDEVML